MGNNFLRILFFLLGMLIILIEKTRFKNKDHYFQIGYWFLGIYASINIVFIIFIWFNHVNFPLHLDLLEGVIWQHFQRAASFQSIYPEPTAEYTPLAYNPLFYVISIPFSWIFGVSLFALRLVAIIGAFGCGLLIYLSLQEKTSSKWWGLIGVGLFAAAYHVMTEYLDTAHSDSWLVFTSLLGSYILDKSRSRTMNMIGLLILISAFWFKQHGVLFLIGGLFYITWKTGVRNSILYWVIAILLVPLFYVFIAPRIFGPYFHYFTWTVPSRWSEFRLQAVLRILIFILKYYQVLCLSACFSLVISLLKNRKNINIWHFQLLVAVLTGIMASLDAENNTNVYIPMGTLFILVGTLGLFEIKNQMKLSSTYQLHLILIVVAFSVFLYNPVYTIVPPEANENYILLVDTLRKIDGHVYAPTIGQLQDDYTLYPAVHWVAIDDIVRGYGLKQSDLLLAQSLMKPIINPQEPIYILSNYPLNEMPGISFLADYYVLDVDYKNTFKPLRLLRGYLDHGWPRYLYRYAPK